MTRVVKTEAFQFQLQKYFCNNGPKEGLTHHPIFPLWTLEAFNCAESQVFVAS